jgi:dihydropteroate synthase
MVNYMEKLFSWLGRVEVGDGLPTRIMGVINVSPESFYKESVKIKYEEIAETALYMEKVGADIIDVGAMSTAPYLRDTLISEEEEAERLRYAIEAVKSSTRLPVSADTHRPKPLIEAIKAGAEIVNDVSGLSNPIIVDMVSEHDLSLIICARRLGILRNPREAIHKALPILENLIQYAVDHGVKLEKIVIDPAIGFHRDTGIEWWKIDVELIRNLREFRRLGRPIMVGVSRKSFIGVLTNREKPEDRLFGSIAIEALSVYLGAHIVRTHNVKETLDAVKVAEALKKV